MSFGNSIDRVRGRYRRILGETFFQRKMLIPGYKHYVSFTFDDFPRSALCIGGAILESFGVRGTYYASFGLMGKEAPTGTIFVRDEVAELLARGHELGCHTFGHCHSWDTPAEVFEYEIGKNQRALQEIAPGLEFRSFSYPVVGPTPRNKRVAGKYFHCSRCGGQTYNTGSVDLNLLKAFFLEKVHGDIAPVRDALLGCVNDRGWLILATHDVSDSPTLYGCTPEFFEEAVRICVDSGARIMPVDAVLNEMTAESRRR